MINKNKNSIKIPSASVFRLKSFLSFFFRLDFKERPKTKVINSFHSESDKNYENKNNLQLKIAPQNQSINIKSRSFSRLFFSTFEILGEIWFIELVIFKYIFQETWKMFIKGYLKFVRIHK